MLTPKTIISPVAKYIPYMCLLLLCVPLYFMGVSDVHPWGDDLAQYLTEAKNIAAGLPYYKSGYIYNAYNSTYAPPQYPPGYPLLIAPLIKVFGLAIRPLLIFNCLLCSLLGMALYRFFTRYTSALAAVCMAVLLLYSGGLLWLKMAVQSDLASVLFVALYFAIRRKGGQTRSQIAMLILVASMAMLVRTQNILLIVAEAGILVLGLVTALKKRAPLWQFAGIKTPLLIMAGSMLLWFVMGKIVFRTPPGGESFYLNYFSLIRNADIANLVSDNSRHLLENLNAHFLYEKPLWLGDSLMHAIRKIFIIAGLLGLVVSIRKGLETKDLFFLLMCLMILFLPVNDNRYALPAVPLAYAYSAIGLGATIGLLGKKLGKNWAIPARVITVTFTAFILATGSQLFANMHQDPCPGCIPTNREFIAYAYIKEHVSDTDIIVFTKPRLLTLYTGKRSINVAWQVPYEKNRQIFDSLGAKYMLVVKWLDDGYYHEYMDKVQHPIDSAQIAEDYVLYRLR